MAAGILDGEPVERELLILSKDEICSPDHSTV